MQMQMQSNAIQCNTMDFAATLKAFPQWQLVRESHQDQGAEKEAEDLKGPGNVEQQKQEREEQATGEKPRANSEFEFEHLACIVADTETFRKQTKLIDEVNDVVIEIGCAFGATTVRILERIKDPKKLLAFDVSDECLEKCKKSFPSIHFENLNCLVEMQKLKRMANALIESNVNEEFNVKPKLVLFVDINGSRELDRIVALLPYLVSFSPKLLVLKSQQLFDACSEKGFNWDEIVPLAKSLGLRRKQEEEKERAPALQKVQVFRQKKKFNESGVRICGFHNYDVRRGCVKQDCPFDHNTCHACSREGHRAVDCMYDDREKDIVDIFFRN